MNRTPLELELRKLGLTEKETLVYLAGLELGPSPVKKISQKVKIPRPTVYEVIKKLKEKELFEETRIKKRRRFLAQSPKNILGILKIKKKEIEEKEREFTRIVAALEAKYLKEEIKIFKGKKGLKEIIEIFSLSSSSKIFFINPHLIPLKRGLQKKIFEKIKRRLGKIEIFEYSLPIKQALLISDKIFCFLAKNKIILIS